MEQGSATIDGIRYEFYQLPIKLALKLSHRLGRYMSAALASASDGSVNVAGAIKGFFDACPEDELVEFVEQLLSKCIAGGMDLSKSGNLDLHFKGRPGLLLRVAAEAGQVYFADFFDALQPYFGRLEGLMDVQVSPSRESAKST